MSLQEPIYELAKKYTRVEFLRVAGCAFTKELDGIRLGCPSSFGLKINCSYSNCNKCWNKAIKNIKFKDEMEECKMENNFKIGDKIRVIDAGNGAHGADGKVGVVTNAKSDSGLSGLIGTFNVGISGRVWAVSKEGTYELIKAKQFTPKDLKSGMVIERRKGGLYLLTLMGDELTGLRHDGKEWIGDFDKRYTDDFKNTFCGSGGDILKVYDVQRQTSFEKIFENVSERNVIWKEETEQDKQKRELQETIDTLKAQLNEATNKLERM